MTDIKLEIAFWASLTNASVWAAATDHAGMAYFWLVVAALIAIGRRMFA
jgi:hypothetical protein